MMPMMIRKTGLSAITALKAVCTAVHTLVAAATPFVAIRYTARAAATPKTSGPIISMLLASQFMKVRTGSRACRAMLLIIVHTCAQVIGILSNFALVSSATENRAFLTTCAVTLPSAAYSLMEPSATPIYCSMALAIPGALSRIEFSSSPLSAPAAIACVSCTIALLCSWAVAPPMTNCLLTCSMNAITWSMSWSKAFPAFSPNLATADAVSR